MRSVRELVELDSFWVPEDMPLARVAELLAERQVNAAPVCAPDGRIVGLLSKTDLTKHYGRDDAELARDVMTPEILSVDADAPADSAIQRMAVEGVHQLVVVDAGGRFVGVITSMDVLRELAGSGRMVPRAASVTTEAPSLHTYRHARIVVQNESTPATEAALAMQKNEIGCVLVGDGRRVVGVVTDRDLALRVVGAGRDPRETLLGEIMSSPVTVLDVNADHERAIRIMRDRNIRRVPLVDGDRVVGMVTLDDLLLERTATAEELAAIVKAQIVEGGPARSHRFDEWTALARRQSRALGTKMSLLSAIRASVGQLSREQAEQALEIVLASLVRGVGEDDRDRLIARLPVALRRRLRELPVGAREATSRAELDRRTARRLGVDVARATEIVRVVGGALARFVRASDPIGRKLPDDLRALLASESPRPSREKRRSRGSEIQS